MFGKKRTKQFKQKPKGKPGRLTYPAQMSSSDFAFMTDAQLDSELAPYLQPRNITAEKFQKMPRQQKEQLLMQCKKVDDDPIDEKTPLPTDVVRRFENVFVLAQNLDRKSEEIQTKIREELLSLRVLVGSANLDWLSKFYLEDGFLPFVKTISHLSSRFEQHYAQPKRNTTVTLAYASALQECIATLRVLLNTPTGMEHCFNPEYDLVTVLFNLMYICNSTDEDSFGTIVAELTRLLKVVPMFEFSNKKLGSMSDYLLQGLDIVAEKRKEPRFAIIVKSFKWKNNELLTLQLLMVFFNMVDNDWKARVFWRHEFWNAGLATHFESLSESGLQNSEIRSLLDIIKKEYERDIRALAMDSVQKDKTYGFDGIYDSLSKRFKKSYNQILVKDILIRLSMICEQDSDLGVLKDLFAVRALLANVLLFSHQSTIEQPAFANFVNVIQSSAMEGDTMRLNEHLQKTVDEKQQAKALQTAYYSEMRMVQDENTKLRAYIDDPSKPLPPQHVVNVKSPKNSDITHSSHSPPKTLTGLDTTQSDSRSFSSPKIASNMGRSAPLAPPPAPGPPPPNLLKSNVSAPPAPPLPPNMAKSAPLPPPLPGSKIVAGPTAPLGVPSLAGLNVKAPTGPKLPTYLKPKDDRIPNMPTRKVADWDANKMATKDINKNSLWVVFQDEEKKFASDSVYSDLMKHFARPKTSGGQGKPAFKRVFKKPVVIQDTDKLRVWEILSGRKIKNAQQFKDALIEVDMSKLDEETLEIVRASLFDESILKKLRETPIANFSNAPGGEQLLAVLSHVTDLRQRLGAILTILTFKRDLDALRSDASSIAEACDQIKNSTGLIQFVALVLVCCNFLMRTADKRALCYGYLMSLLPKLEGTKDVSNKLTLLDHLIVIFDRITNSKYAGFGQYDFMQVAKARRLDYAAVIDSIKVLSNKVTGVKSYHSSFKKLSPNDRLGQLLGDKMPELLKDVENLLHLKQSMESKVAEIEEFFSYDPKKYGLATLFSDIYTFSIHYKASYEKIKSVSSSAVRKPSSQPQPAIKIKSNENVIQRKKFENRGLLETLESRLEIGQYKPRGGSRPPRDSANKENMTPKKKKTDGNNLNLDVLLSRLDRVRDF